MHISQITNRMVIAPDGLYHHANDNYLSSDHSTLLPLNSEKHNVLSPPSVSRIISLDEIVMYYRLY